MLVVVGATVVVVVVGPVVVVVGANVVVVVVGPTVVVVVVGATVVVVVVGATVVDGTVDVLDAGADESSSSPQATTSSVIAAMNQIRRVISRTLSTGAGRTPAGTVGGDGVDALDLRQAPTAAARS